MKKSDNFRLLKLFYFFKKQKIEELKKQKESRVQDDKFDEMKKQLIIEKSKKTEEIKRIAKVVPLAALELNQKLIIELRK